MFNLLFIFTYLFIYLYHWLFRETLLFLFFVFTQHFVSMVVRVPHNNAEKIYYFYLQFKILCFHTYLFLNYQNKKVSCRQDEIQFVFFYI